MGEALERGLRTVARVEKRYVYKSNHTEIAPDSDEYSQLSEAMKKSCEGLTVVKSDTEIVSEEEHLKRNVIGITATDKRVKGGSCKSIMAACQENMNWEDCWYWTINDLELYSLHHITIDRAEQLCVKCCDSYDQITPIIPCECI